MLNISWILVIRSQIKKKTRKGCESVCSWNNWINGTTKKQASCSSSRIEDGSKWKWRLSRTSKAISTLTCFWKVPFSFYRKHIKSFAPIHSIFFAAFPQSTLKRSHTQIQNEERDNNDLRKSQVFRIYAVMKTIRVSDCFQCRRRAEINGNVCILNERHRCARALIYFEQLAIIRVLILPV